MHPASSCSSSVCFRNHIKSWFQILSTGLSQNDEVSDADQYLAYSYLLITLVNNNNNTNTNNKHINECELKY